MIATETSIPSTNQLPALSAEFKHVPLSVWRSLLNKWEAPLRLAITALLLVFLVVAACWHSPVPLVLGSVVVGAGCLCMILKIRGALARTATIDFNSRGVGLVLGESTFVLPWQTLLRADLRNSELSLVFDEQRIPQETRRGVLRFWMRRSNEGECLLPIDLRAVAKRDHLKIVSVLNRLAPRDRISESLSRFASPQHNPGFTELWNESLKITARRNSVNQLNPGDWLNEYRFEVVRQLGAGGQGVAYEAIDHYPPSDAASRVVLKEFVLPVHGDPSAAAEALNMVQQEADIIRSLNCDFAVKYYDLFVEDSRAYLVREFVDGHSLKEIVHVQGALELDEVYSLALNMCDILEHLHSHSPAIIHRDFTPDNLLLNQDKQLKLIDFDIARAEDNCKTNQVVGKPNYLSPEQFRGNATTQSDIYSLGATLFFISTATQPKPISASHPKARVDTLDDRFDAIVAKATATDCLERYRTTAELRRDILEARNVDQ